MHNSDNEDAKSTISRRTSYHSVTCVSNINCKPSTVLSSCRICLSKIVDPASLTCGHKFCEKCLSVYWQYSEMPDSLICPLCRDHVTNISFAKKEQVTSTEDFRKTFQSDDIRAESKNTVNNLFILCLKLSILIPIVYYVVTWLKPIFLDTASYALPKLRQYLFMESNKR